MSPRPRSLRLPELAFVAVLALPACASILGADFDRPARVEPTEGGAPSVEGGAAACAKACPEGPSGVCLDATTRRAYVTRGCAETECRYLYYDVLCASGCDRGLCLGSDPCANVACVTPPASTCVDGKTLESYVPSGTCAAGRCSYDKRRTTCTTRCTNGACENEPCAGVSCTSPPPSTCGSPTSRRSFGNGTCSEGKCSYPPSDTACTNGCQAGACAGDPCVGVTCDAAPAAACVDATTRRSYAPTGTCGGGTCTYARTETACPNGCEAGACKGDPCAGVTCTTPPTATCITQDSLRTFAQTGTCNQATCAYPPSDTPCARGCSGGRCLAEGGCTSVLSNCTTAIQIATVSGDARATRSVTGTKGNWFRITAREDNLGVVLTNLRLAFALTSSLPNAFRVRAYMSSAPSIKCPPSAADLDTADSSNIDWQDTLGTDDSRTFSIEIYPTPSCVMGASWSLTLTSGT